MPIRFHAAQIHIEELKKGKSEIIQTWMDSPDIQKTLPHHGVSTDFFAKYFGNKVIDYALGIIEGKNKLGNCPVIGVMLVFFEKKNIPLEDVFMICVNLKNTLIRFMLNKGILDEMLLIEICGLIDHNFYGVIKEYLELHYNPTVEYTSCDLTTRFNPSQQCNTVIDSLSLSSPSFSRSAREYTKEIEISYDVMDELAELEEETLESLNLSEGFSNSIGYEIVGLFSQYAKMINRLGEFEDLSYALFVLVDILKQVDFTDFESQSTYLQIYTKAIINDLIMWRISVFLDKSAEDIHYLDKTLLSSIAQLQILLSPADLAQTEEIEFF